MIPSKFKEKPQEAKALYKKLVAEVKAEAREKMPKPDGDQVLAIIRERWAKICGDAYAPQPPVPTMGKPVAVPGSVKDVSPFGTPQAERKIRTPDDKSGLPEDVGATSEVPIRKSHRTAMVTQ